jgi:Zn-dependent protease
MQGLNLIQQVAVWALPVLFAITIHEVAHGWMARQLGDPTAMMLGRLTLNPLKHIDPVGTVLVPLTLIVLSQFTSGGFFIFGWAKPVPITAQNLRHPKRDMALVAAAGPMSNLIMALFWALLMKLAQVLTGGAMGLSIPLAYMAGAGIAINVLLLVLNLLPVPPLDGSRVVAGFLPDPLAWKYNRLEQYGLIILLALMMTGILGKIMWPPVAMVQNMIYRLFGI